ncbi:MAG: zinc ribbon domain-containing protein [Chloroflexota bacterium]
MPIYEYECDQCHNKFEMRKSMSEASNYVSCPSCKSNETHRYWSAPNITGKSTSDQKAVPPYSGITTMNDVTITNCGTGIQVENAEVRGKNVKLRGNKKALVAKHAKVEIEGLEID